MLEWKKSERQYSSMFAFHGRLSRFRACSAGNLCSGECRLREELENTELEQPGVNKDLDLPVYNCMHLLARFDFFFIFIFFFQLFYGGADYTPIVSSHLHKLPA